ncbi:MAG: DNA primase [Candidatus Electrothrix aestuarii]|uniref:DNA primase n=1 Tax=Candidatus Electrothrix aestuarii TaxID=3062594 RepID=A0AAU8LW38_9BACT|nr:DNA primase [Candidatus Electrothrix aestuarii]
MTSNKGAWEEVKNRVREAADIVQVIGEHVRLKKTGTGFTGLCPFHGEKTSSFSVNPQRQFFHCFGCHESGDVFSFMMKYHHMTFPEALKDLARRYQIDLPEANLSESQRERIRQREQLYRVNQEALHVFHKTLVSSELAQAARKYLHERGVPQDAVEKYQLGYAPSPERAGWQFLISRLQKKNFPVSDIEQAGLAVHKAQGRYYDRFRDRVLFPIYDLSGRAVAFGGRILGEGKPKYMNSPESMVFTKSNLLFGLYQHRQAIRTSRRAIVVEGNFDLLLLAIHGIDNVVAPLGTALTQEHIKSLRRYCDEVVLFFDGDSAGLRAARRTIPFFLSEQVEGRVALLPQGHDPDTLIREKGAAAVQNLIENAAPLAEFIFSALKEEHGFTLSGKNRIIAELAELMKSALDEEQRELMAAHFSEQLGVSPERFLIEQEAGTPSDQFVAPQWETGPGPGIPLDSDWDHQGLPPDLPPDLAPEFHEDWEGYSSPMEPEQGSASLYDLPKRQQQLLDFLLLYPEFFSDLLAGGLKESLGPSPLLGLIEAMEQIAAKSADGAFVAEQLLSVVTSRAERQYIAELLSKDGGNHLGGESEEEGRAFCDELLLWLKMTQRKREGEALQQQIFAAEQRGNYELVNKLTKEMLSVRMKNNFS